MPLRSTVLLVDTIYPTGPRLGLAVNGRLRWRILRQQFHASERLVPFLQSLFLRSRVRVQELRGILVASGPGSFTRVRSGVVLANALALALQVPIHAIEGKARDADWLVASQAIGNDRSWIGAVVTPMYSAPPSISRLKKYS